MRKTYPTGRAASRSRRRARRRMAAAISLLLSLGVVLGQAGLLAASAEESAIAEAPAAEETAAPTEEPAEAAPEEPDPSPTEAPAEPAPAEEPSPAPSPAPKATTTSRSRSTDGATRTKAAPSGSTDLAAGDFSLDFVAAGPFTYDHGTGSGGAYGNRTISKTTGVVESLEGGDFSCGDLVVFFTKVSVGSGKTGSATIQLDYVFDGEPTGQPGVGFVDLISAGPNPNPPDSGNTADGDESVSIVSEVFDTSGPDELKATIQISGLESGEAFILRLVVELGCLPGSSPTGNIQSRIPSARFMTTPTPQAINVGQQTIPLKKVEDVAQPGISVTKSCPASGAVGEEITYEITVENTGNEPLENLVVSDPLLGGTLGSFPSTLGVGESVTRSFKHTVGEDDLDPLTNTVTATAVGADSRTEVSDEASCELDVVHPAIDLQKDGATLAHVGDTVTYTFRVENVGDVDLFAVTLTDPICDAAPVLVDDGDGNDVLAVGEVWRYECDHLITAEDPDPLPNTAEVTAVDDREDEVSDQDSHEVDLIHPAIRIVKTVDPVSGSPGDEVTYTYAVTNIGDTTLFDVSVDDDKLGHIGDIPVLEPGEKVLLIATAVLGNQEGELVNVGTTEGEDVLGEVVTDDDDAAVSIVLAAGGDEPKPKPPADEVAFTGLAAHWAALLTVGLLSLGLALLAIGRRRGRTVAV